MSSTAWNEEPSRGLALVLLLDQFPRQFWRDTAMAFAGDLQALALSLMAVERGRLEAEDEQARRQFWLMPLMHSEDLAEQEAAPAAVRAVQRSPHRRLRPPAPGCDRPLWPLPPPQCCVWGGCRARRSWPSCRRRAHASEPSGPWVAGRWPVLTQMVQPASLQGRCTLPGGLRNQLPAG